MDCLTSTCYNATTSSPSSSSSSSSLVCIDEVTEKAPTGYLSDGIVGRAQERKKGVSWTEEEHKSFLIGLAKLGKGDWRGISRNFVKTRTPTQVASHAQKYFLRQTCLNKKKRRSSLFDVGTTADTAKFREPTSFTFEVRGNSKNNTGLDLNSSCLEQEAMAVPNLELSIGSSSIYQSNSTTIRVT